MKASRFFGVYAPAIYVLERQNLGSEYALVGGYGCKYWYKHYCDGYIKNLKSVDIDLRGERYPVAIALRDYWPATMIGPQRHEDNPDSATYVLLHRLNKSGKAPAKAEVIKLVPTLDLNSPVAQGIAYRLPCKYDKSLTVSVLDPCSLFVSKYPAFLNLNRRRNPDKHDGEHLELLAAILPKFLSEAATLPQAQTPSRDPRIAARRLLSVLQPPRELPAGIDRDSLIHQLNAFVSPATPTHYPAEPGL